MSEFEQPHLLLLLAATFVLALAGCGSSDEPSSAGAGSTPAAAGSFLAEATHMYGTTAVPKAPERIVIVGLTEVVDLCGGRPVALELPVLEPPPRLRLWG